MPDVQPLVDLGRHAGRDDDRGVELLDDRRARRAAPAARSLAPVHRRVDRVALVEDDSRASARLGRRPFGVVAGELGFGVTPIACS
jgi:hypothetical protein